MTDTRKTVKVTIPADKVADFAEAKKRAEDFTMISMTDTQYASRLIQWAIDNQDNASVVFRPESHDTFRMHITGRPGTKEHEAACRAAYLYETNNI